MSFFKNIEASIAGTNDLAYQHLEYYWGKQLELFRPEKSDIYSKVHNKDANSALRKLKDFIGITQADDLSTTDNYNQADFDEGFLITKETEILAGDVILFNQNGAHSRWKVEKKVDIGFTSTMYFKYVLSNMN